MFYVFKELISQKNAFKSHFGLTQKKVASIVAIKPNIFSFNHPSHLFWATTISPFCMGRVAIPLVPLSFIDGNVTVAANLAGHGNGTNYDFNSSHFKSFCNFLSVLHPAYLWVQNIYAKRLCSNHFKSQPSKIPKCLHFF